MKEKAFKVCDFLVYWSIVIIPFAVAISPAMANVFIGFMFGFFLLKKLLEMNRNEKLLTDTAINLPFLLVIVFSLLSFWNSVDIADSVKGMLKLIKYGLIFLICAQELKDTRQAKRMIGSIILGAVLVSLDGLWQLISGFDFIRGNRLQSASIDLARPTASFPNPNVMGIYLSALVPLILGLAIFLKPKLKIRIFLIVASMIALTGVYITFSRGSGLGVFFSLLFLGILKKNKLLTVILLILLVIFPFVMPKNIKGWAKEIRYNPLVFLFNQDRLSMYQNTLNMIRHHPLVGVGVNTFSKNYAKYKLAKVEEQFPTLDTTYTHNMYLQMGGEIGLLGLSAFLWLLFMFFRENLRTFHSLKDGFLQTICLSLGACVIAFLVNGMTETSLYYARVSPIFWYLIGFSLALSKFAKTEP